MQLVFDKVSYTYSGHEGQTEALKDVSFTLEDGELLGIIGHTGSGKSTLLQLMCGLMLPTSGEVYLNSKPLSDKKYRRKIFADVGIAFQYPEQQLFAQTVAEDIGFAPRNMGLNATEVDKKMRQAMQAMHLDYERYAKLSPFELSGGEMRRVALAGVIANAPKLLILDEPSAGLDPKGRRELKQIVEDYHKAGNTVVLVSHNMDNIAALSDKTLVLKNGSISLYGDTAEVFSHQEELRAINLGQPWAMSFAASLQELGIDLPSEILTIEALADALAQALSTHNKDSVAMLHEPQGDHHEGLQIAPPPAEKQALSHTNQGEVYHAG